MYFLNYDASLRSMQLILGFNVLLHLSAKVRSDPAAVWRFKTCALRDCELYRNFILSS